VTGAPVPGPVAILGGTGKEGRGLAARWSAAGIEIVLGSRDPERAAAAATEIATLTGRPVSGAGNQKAAALGRLAVIATPFDGMEATLLACAGALTGKLVVSAVVPLSVVDGRFGLLPVEAGSAAELAQACLPGSRVAAAFHAISAPLLLRLEHQLDEDVPVAADDAADRETVAALADALGGRGVPVGPLPLARYLEGVTPLLLSLNRLRRVNAGIRFTGLG
jgi:NADPH-dependent F420 reductase